MTVAAKLSRHPGEGRDPRLGSTEFAAWTPAFAGVTITGNGHG